MDDIDRAGRATCRSCCATTATERSSRTRSAGLETARGRAPERSPASLKQGRVFDEAGGPDLDGHAECFAGELLDGGTEAVPPSGTVRRTSARTRDVEAAPGS
jgi:hypothetical protein